MSTGNQELNVYRNQSTTEFKILKEEKFQAHSDTVI